MYFTNNRRREIGIFFYTDSFTSPLINSEISDMFLKINNCYLTDFGKHMTEPFQYIEKKNK